jgi:hypothetical protein
MLEVRTAGIPGSPAIKTFPMLNDRHPGIGTAGGVHGWLEKKRAACEEAEQDPLRQFTAEPDKGHRRRWTAGVFSSFSTIHRRKLSQV